MKAKYRFVEKIDAGDSSTFFLTERRGFFGGWTSIISTLSSNKERAWDSYKRIVMGQWKNQKTILHTLPDNLSDPKAIEAWLKLNEPDT